jgi:iron complex transport system substrate-binding protein
MRRFSRATWSGAGSKQRDRCRFRFEYEGLRFSEALRIDILVESRVIVEIKSVEKLAPVHPKQLLTYLRLLKLPVGLLVNFGAAHLNDGLKRIVNGFRDGNIDHIRTDRA